MYRSVLAALGFAVASVSFAAQADEGGLKISGFADAFYKQDLNFPDQPRANDGVPHRAYDFTNGFGLAFGGLNVAYEGKGYGAQFDVRAGQGAVQFLLINDAGQGPNAVALNQAYGYWDATENLTLTFGLFNTIYGAEVAESWENLNYTRGALYYAMQPFFHTGAKADISLADNMGLTFLVTSGQQQGLENNMVPNVGAQFFIAPSEGLEIYLGYFGGAEGDAGQPNDESWSHFGDLVVTFSSGPLSIIGNFDVGQKTEVPVEDGNGNVTLEDQLFWGVSLALGYAIDNQWGVAGRFEYLSDEDDFVGSYESLITGTLTLDYRPLENVILRLDGRLEKADGDNGAGDIYVDSDGEPTDMDISAIAGVVVKFGG